MKVKASIEVDINLDQQKKITKDYLLMKFRIPKNAYLEEHSGWLVEDVVCATSHSWVETKSIRKATSEDLMVLKILEELDA